MASGRKDIALFELIPAEFSQNKMRLSLGRIALDPHTTIFFIKGKESKAQELVALLMQSRQQAFNENTERSIGRLLAYEEKDIDAFIVHAKSLQEEIERIRRNL